MSCKNFLNLIFLGEIYLLFLGSNVIVLNMLNGWDFMIYNSNFIWYEKFEKYFDFDNF